MTEKRRRLWLLFGAAALLGLLAGTALPEWMRMGEGTYAGFFSLYGYQKFQEITVRPWELFPYIAAGRIRMFLFLWMSAFTPAGALFHSFYLFWTAAAAGMLLSLFVLRGGYEGILLFLCCIFPQWLLYASVWRQELLFFLHSRERKPYAALDGQPGAAGLDLKKLALMLAVCMLGCLLEAYPGLWTLKIFLRFIS